MHYHIRHGCLTFSGVFGRLPLVAPECWDVVNSGLSEYSIETAKHFLHLQFISKLARQRQCTRNNALSYGVQVQFKSQPQFPFFLSFLSGCAGTALGT